MRATGATGLSGGATICRSALCARPQVDNEWETVGGSEVIEEVERVVETRGDLIVFLADVVFRVHVDRS